MNNINKDLYKNLQNRIRLTSRGIQIPVWNGKPLPRLNSIGLGAGPQGKTFYLYSPDKKNTGQMISVPVLPHDHHLFSYALKTELGDIPGTIITEDGIILKSVPLPNFTKAILSDGTPINKDGIVMRHCYNTCTSVLGFACQHFENKQECQYCEIESVGRNKLGFPEKQDLDRFSEAIQLISEKDKIRSVTITSGTFSEPDIVARYFIQVLKKIRKKIKITIHIQHEPLKDLSLHNELSQLADSVGIFLEIFDENIRKNICPGKAKISLEQYKTNWQKAVESYGRGKVGTTCLLGFGVPFDKILQKIDEYAKMGVLTSLLFVRCKSQKLKNFIPTYLQKNEKELVDLFLNAAQIQIKQNLSYAIGKNSGCMGCQGCSSMNEACQLVHMI